MAVALSNTNENLETYCLIWLDASVNDSHENRQAQQQLQTIINHLLTFEDDQQFLQYIENLSKNDRVVLIVSGRFGRKIVPQIVNLRQINSIYVYCFDKKANDQWAQHFTKVKGVVVQLNELIQRIAEDYTRSQYTKLDESLSIQIYNNEQFIHSQLLIDCLIRMNTSTVNTKTELISFCQQYYKNNNAQLMIIKEFEKDYSSERALLWYIRQSFLSRLLNKAFREQNIDLLYRFRFLIHDMGCQLGKNRCLSSMRIYRSQLISKEELQLLKNSIGQVISMNSFLTASIDRDQTRLSLDSVDLSNDIEKIFFEIEANSQLHNIKSFGIIQSKCKEVLFMVGSIFRINQIERANGNIWNVQLSLCSADDQQIKPFFENIKNQLGVGKTNLFRFGHVLYQMGKVIQAEKYHRRYLNQLPNGHSDISRCYHALGMIAESKKDFISSVKWYKKSLETQESESSSSADTYDNIANVYFKTGDYTKALKSYQKALEIWKKTLDGNHPRIAKCLNDMGLVYEMKKKYSEALEYYQKALKISKKNLSSKHPDIALTRQNIGNVYELKCEYQQALTYYEKALKIYRYSLPATQTSVNDIEKMIRRVSSKLE